MTHGYTNSNNSKPCDRRCFYLSTSGKPGKKYHVFSTISLANCSSCVANIVYMRAKLDPQLRGMFHNPCVPLIYNNLRKILSVCGKIRDTRRQLRIIERTRAVPIMSYAVAIRVGPGRSLQFPRVSSSRACVCRKGGRCHVYDNGFS